MNKNSLVRKSTRVRIKPKIWDATFILTYSNIKTFRKLLNLIKNKGKIKILDLGCGYKPFEILFKDFGFEYEYIGVDFDKENASPDIIIDLNYEKLPFENETFDVVILSEVLEHIYNTKNVINEALRVLKKDGFIYISTPFVFPEHGIPYDYFRFTEFFYIKLAEHYNLKVVFINKSGSYLSVPLVSINLFLEGLLRKFKLSVMSYPLFFFTNLIALISDIIVSKLTFAEIHKKLKRLYIGISIIYKKI